MSIPDTLTAKYALLATNMSEEEVAEIHRLVGKGGPSAAEAKRAVAREIVAMYHGVQKAIDAEERFDVQFRKHQVPDDVPVKTTSELQHGVDAVLVRRRSDVPPAVWNEELASIQAKPRPGAIPSQLTPIEAIEQGLIYLPALLVSLGWAKSVNEAKKQIEGGGLRINGEQWKRLYCLYAPLEFGDLLVQLGRRRFVRLVS